LTAATNPFPNYTELRRRLPIGAWHAVRVVSVVVFLGLCAGLWVRPAGGLFFFWRVLVPLLPLTFLLAPGLWRNVCPLAAANQAPRLWRITRAKPQAEFLKRRGFAVAICFFAVIVMTRRPLLDKSGPALSILLSGLIVAAFATGATWRGKSGWCTSICPLLPIQRLYGQTPFATIPNSHCQPCVGCTKNCHDFNPRAAYQADMHDPDPDWSAPRKLFAGAFPGIVYGFFTVHAAASTVHVYAHILLGAAVGAGGLYALRALLPLTDSQAAVLGGVAAANVFYWYQGPAMAKTWGQVFGVSMGWLSPTVRVGVAVVTAAWFARTLRAERQYKVQAIASAQPVKLSPTRVAKLSAASTGDEPEVTILPDDRVVVAGLGATLLEVCEADGQAIEAGCRMGMCGSDPVVVLEGMVNLSPVGDDEAATLRRLGCGPDVRMACSARVAGSVCISLDLAAAAAAGPAASPAYAAVPADPSIRTVVVLGNGIAGVTAAESIRRAHPDCDIHLVGKEAHNLYNRMGISRIVYGRSAMQGLSLLPETWYDEHRITCWLNTQAQSIDTTAQTVALATGNDLHYDRLILAMGSASFLPPMPGYGKAGSFVLRDADDAVAIRRFAQERGAMRAVVAGGGLLGLEAAHALHSLGLVTTVLERAPRLLMNQADERASELLAEYLRNLGINVLLDVSITEVQGDDVVSGVGLSDGRTKPCDVLLVAAGITPNATLARDAGMAVNRGVIVDDQMRTSAPNVFAAGDVAELDGQVLGLWPIAVKQAEVAARNALGGAEAHVSTLPRALLKGVGIDVLSVGRINPAEGDDAIVIDDGRDHRYTKIVVSEGRVVGALLVGHPADHDAFTRAVLDRLPVADLRDRLPVAAP
jgi:nitrite reductase (NADH) large subunit